MAEDRPTGKKGLSDFLEGLNGLLELVNTMQEHGSEGITKSGEFKTESGMSGVYGVKIGTAKGGAPVFEHFGNIGRRKGPGLVSDEREPLLDIFEEENQVTVVAEIPGAIEDSIKVEIDNQRLTLAASARDRRYRKELTLPYELSSVPIKRSYVNGIFSIVLKRAAQTIGQR